MNLYPEVAKNEENKALEGTKIDAIEGWKYLGGSWGISSGTWGDLVEISGEVEAKMGATWANLGQS